MELSENKRLMQAGELYHAFTPELVAERARCTEAVNRFNDTRDTTRRRRVALWRDIIQDTRPMPPDGATPEDDAAQFDATDPWIEPPLRVDYGTQVQIAAGAFINFNATFIDTLPIKIGARTLVGPNCSFYSGTHPLDPSIRKGTEGPEAGKEIEIGEDCWLGGNVIILPGVKIGRGAVCGAGAVVTKDVPAFHIVAGNPARVLRKVPTDMDPEQREILEYYRDSAFLKFKSTRTMQYCPYIGPSPAKLEYRLKLH